MLRLSLLWMSLLALLFVGCPAADDDDSADDDDATADDDDDSSADDDDDDATADDDDDDDATGVPLDPSFASDVWPIIQSNCSCHQVQASGGWRHAGDSATFYDLMVDVDSAQNPAMKRVKPGESFNSWLQHKIDGTHEDFADKKLVVGQRMPRNGPPYLTEDEADTIRNWINEGAQDN